MAGKPIIDWSKAPVDATHAGDVYGDMYWYKLTDGCFQFMSKANNMWQSCGESGPTAPIVLPRPVVFPQPVYADSQGVVHSGDYTIEQLRRATTEHFMCCGTTCDREAVKRYIERLEVVADAAHHLEASGVLAGTPRMQNLKMALEELKSE